MNTYTLRNNTINEVVTVHAESLIKAKFKAAAMFRGTYPDVKGSPNSVFLWWAVQAATLIRIK